MCRVGSQSARIHPQGEFPRDVHETLVNLARERWYSDPSCVSTKRSLPLRPVIAREGYTIIAVVVALALLLGLGALWVDAWLWRAPVLVLAVGMVAFTLYFFRDPERTPPPHARDNGLLAPADGRVVEIADEEEPLYLNGPARRISIFLSPLDVHVNRVPARGVIEYAQYRPGDYLVAWHPKASEKNDRSEFGLRHPSGTKVVFKQIAGAVARRIEYNLAEGDTVAAGERFGIVKFGSRMDLLVPLSVDLDVEEGQVVRAGTTLLGHVSTEPERTTSPSAAAPGAPESSSAASSPPS